MTKVPTPNQRRVIQIRKAITSVHSASSFSLMALNLWKITPERTAIRLVRSILTDSPSPLTMKEIYEEAVRRETGREYPHPPTVIADASAQKPGKPVKKRGVVRKLPPAPPHPENAVRSMRCVCARVCNSGFEAEVPGGSEFGTDTSKPSCCHICATTSKKSRNFTRFEPCPTRRPNTGWPR